MNQSDITFSSDPFINKNIIEPYSAGELSGLSFAVKDNIDIANEITGYGSPGWKATHTKAVVNALCVEQLLNVGGCYKGKTKLDELAYSLLGANPFYGTPRNPKFPGRIPGGSSSGSASAVASGIVDFALGSDTGGSIRMPACNCGIWGYRPSHGAVSNAGMLTLAPSYDTVGVLAESGEILQKVMRVLLAEDEREYNSSFSLCFIDDIFQIADGQILQALKPGMNKITGNYKTEKISLADITGIGTNCVRLFELLGILLSAEIWNTFGAWVKNGKPELSKEVEKNFRNYAGSVNRKEIQKSLMERKAFQNKINSFLVKGNILCFPTVIDTAPRIDELTPEFFAGNYIPRAMSVNAVSCLSSTPQITIPLTNDGDVPVGISFITGYGNDMALINFCNELFDNCL